MADSKYFGIPFASTGDRVAIPEGTDPSGAVSYQQGFGPDYERNPATDPAAKRVPRDETNEYLFQITNAIKFLQLTGAPEWYPDDGSGAPVSYPVGARVRHAGRVWSSRVAANIVEPGTDITKWWGDDPFSLESLQTVLDPASTAMGFSGNFDTNGYIRLPSFLGNLQIVWGIAVTPTNPTVVTLPRAFNTVGLQVIAGESGAGLVTFGAGFVDKSRIQIYTSNTSAGIARYIAIGY